MPVPPHDQLQAVVRGLTTTTRDGQEMRLLTAERHYPAEVEEVWDALTNPVRVPRWLGGAVTGELSLGGRYQIEGNAGGEVLDCRPPSALSLTWEYGGTDQLGRRHADHRRGPDPAARSSTPPRSTRRCGTSSAPERSGSAGRWR